MVALAGRPSMQVLGPLGVLDGDEMHELGVGRPAALLARLVIAGGRPLTADQLAEDVWGASGATAEGTVRVTIGRLRSMLGPQAIVRHGRGYALGPVDVDLAKFDMLTAPPLAGWPQLSSLDDALALVRGVPFAGLDGYPFIDDERRRLDDRIRRVIDERLDLLLENGAGAEHVAEFEAAVQDEPLNERRCGALMTVLYRAGRHADALAVLRTLETRLREERGVLPSPTLRDIELRILRHDRDLLGPQAANTMSREAVAEIDAVVRSATSLARLGAYEAALRFSRQGLDVARQLHDEALLCRCLVAFARISDCAGEHDPDADTSAASAALDEATDLARGRRDGALLAEVALSRFARGIAPADDQEVVSLTEPLELLPRHAPERIRLLCATAAVLTYTNDTGMADRLFTQIDQLADESDDPRSRALRAAAICMLAAHRPMPLAEIERRSYEALELAVRVDDSALLTIALHARLLAMLFRGDLEEVARLAPVIAQAGREALLPFAVQRERLLETALALADGRLDGLDARIDDSVELSGRIGTVAVNAQHSQRVMLAWELADADRLDLLLQPQPWENSRAGVLAPIVRLLVAAERDPGRRSDSFARFEGFASTVAPAPLAAPMASTIAELAWWTRSKILANVALPALELLADRMVVLGIGTLVLGPAAMYAGLCHDVLGDSETAAKLLEAAARHADKHGGALHAARARVWLAGARRGPATLEPADPVTPRLAHLIQYVDALHR